MSCSDLIRSFVQGDHVCLGSIEKCSEAGNCECIVCGVRDCPYREPLHYHHDGCPACSQSDIAEDCEYSQEFYNAHAEYGRLYDEDKKNNGGVKSQRTIAAQRVCESHGMVFDK